MDSPPEGDWTDLDALLNKVGTRESQWLEFKQALPKASDLQEPFVAFANASGGLVVVGVTDVDPRRLTGVPDDQRTLERVEEAARVSHPPVSVRARLARVGGQAVCLVAVPALRRGFVQTSSGRLLVRAGPVNRTLVGDDLVAFVTERAIEPPEDRIVPGATIEDLDGSVARAYLRKRLSRSRVALDVGLRDLGLLVDQKPTLACLLLFGRAPQTARRRFGIDVLRYEGTHSGVHTLRDRRQLTGTLPQLVSAADGLIYEQMRRDAVVRGLVREEVPEYPPVAIREALLNAVGHRDYSRLGASVQVRLFDDLLEIESPGTLPGVVTVDNLKDAQYSRNARIMDVFHEYRLVEEAGEGIDRMFEAMENALLSAPEFRESSNSFTVRLRSSGVLRAEDRIWLEGLLDLPPGPDARLALVRARTHGWVTNETLRTLRPLQPRAAREVLQALVARGHLVASGSGRGTRYVLSELASVARAPSADAHVTAAVAYARRVGAVANRDVRGLLGLGREEALRILEEAVAAGLLEAEGNRRARRYLPVRP